MTDWENIELKAEGLTSWFYLTKEEAMEFGLIPDTRPPYVPPRRSWRRRLWWWWWCKRDDLGRVLYRWITGNDTPGDDW